MRLTFSLLLATVLYSCSSLTPIDKEIREYTDVVEIDVEADEAYHSAEAYFARQIKNSNHAFRLRDNENLRIIAKISFGCENIKRPDVRVGFVEVNQIDYMIDLQFRDNRARFILEAQSLQAQRASGLQLRPIYEASGQREALEKCHESLVDSIVTGISSDSSRSKTDW